MPPPASMLPSPSGSAPPMPRPSASGETGSIPVPPPKFPPVGDMPPPAVDVSHCMNWLTKSLSLPAAPAGANDPPGAASGGVMKNVCTPHDGPGSDSPRSEPVPVQIPPGLATTAASCWRCRPCRTACRACRAALAGEDLAFQIAPPHHFHAHACVHPRIKHAVHVRVVALPAAHHALVGHHLLLHHLTDHVHHLLRLQIAALRG